MRSADGTDPQGPMRSSRRALAALLLTAAVLPVRPTVSAVAEDPPQESALRRRAERVRRMWRDVRAATAFADLVDAPELLLPALRGVEADLLAGPVDGATIFRAAADALATARPTAPAELRALLVDSPPSIELRDLLVEFAPDDTIEIPAHVASLTLQRCVLVKRTGISPILRVTGSACAIRGGTFVGSISRRGYFSSAAVELRDADRSAVLEADFLVAGGAAVQVFDSTGVDVVGNRVGSTFGAAGRPHVELGHDVLFWGACSDAVVGWNVLASRRGIGAMLQVGVEGDSVQSSNVVVGNHVDGCQQYGISLYSRRLHQPARSRGALICGNTVEHVSGRSAHSTLGRRIFGSGIYVQGQDETVILGNRVRDVAHGTDMQLLGPAALSAVNTSSVCMLANDVEDSAWYGAYLKDTEGVDPTGRSAVRANRFARCRRGGVRIACVDPVAVADNRFELDVGVPELDIVERCASR